MAKLVEALWSAVASSYPLSKEWVVNLRMRAF